MCIYWGLSWVCHKCSRAEVGQPYIGGFVTDYCGFILETPTFLSLYMPGSPVYRYTLFSCFFTFNDLESGPKVHTGTTKLSMKCGSATCWTSTKRPDPFRACSTQS